MNAAELQAPLPGDEYLTGSRLVVELRCLGACGRVELHRRRYDPAWGREVARCSVCGFEVEQAQGALGTG